MRELRRCRSVVLAWLALSAMPGVTSAQSCSTNRISLDANGFEYGEHSAYPAISAYGRFVTFATAAALLPSDTNPGYRDTYLVDTTDGSLELISVTPQGTSGNLESEFRADLSDDGRMVAFHSHATNLVPGLGNFLHAFVRDRMLGQTQLVSVGNTGVHGDCVSEVRISGDGRYVVFASYWGAMHPGDNNSSSDVFLRDLQTGNLELISVTPAGTVANDDSAWGDGADISADGRYVFFRSQATNLVAGYVPAAEDIYVRDRLLGVTSVVSLGMQGQRSNGHSAGPVCSEDGRFVAFSSAASNLVPGDTNNQIDIFVCNVGSRATERVSMSSSGLQSDGWSNTPSISLDSRFVAFTSLASNLVPSDTNGLWDVFLHDRLTGQTQRMSVDSAGVESDGDSNYISISRDGVELVFHSAGSNLVAGDSNAKIDVFHRRCSPPAAYCTAKINSLGCRPTTSTSGIPMASGSQGFYVEAHQVLNQKAGLLLYSTVGANVAPFAGGFLCVTPPVRRTPGQSSGGSPAGLDCTGAYSFDFNAWIASGAHPGLMAGTTVWAQYWTRDPGFVPPFDVGLTDAQTFVIWP